ncbi:unnamed protein product, partial [Meganyctiphanes norvegica]
MSDHEDEQEEEVLENNAHDSSTTQSMGLCFKKIELMAGVDNMVAINDVVIEEDSHRTPFTPQEPKIMILRRPQAGSISNGMLNNKPRQPVKTLEQRQAEYAEARLRILGDTGGSTTEDSSKPKPVQQKSFEQREADYAAARLRIMGSSKSVEEPMVSGCSS